MNGLNLITDNIIKHFPDIQAIYLFGSHGTDYEFPHSDIDIALLLPRDTSVKTGSLALADIGFELENIAGRDVDLVDLRKATTVFQKEIVAGGRRVYCADIYASDEFEMLTISYYQKLNDERKEILDEFFRSGRAYNV